MSRRGAVRRGVAWLGWVGALCTAVSCYRAEVDLAPLFDDTSPGVSGAGGEQGNAGAAGAASPIECDPTPDEPIQSQCRLRPPSKQVCDEQDKPGWAGCYNGGCSICTEVLVDYPYYLARHPCCGPNSTCGVHAPLLCSPLCPPPSELDKKPPCYELER